MPKYIPMVKIQDYDRSLLCKLIFSYHFQSYINLILRYHSDFRLYISVNMLLPKKVSFMSLLELICMGDVTNGNGV